MQIEYEATFLNVDKNDIRSRLKKAGAKMVYPEFLQKRYVWNFPKGHEVEGGWVRVRQEYDKITLSVKIVDGRKIEDQRESCITVDNMETARDIINSLGCQERAYQETKRELWRLGKADITIDEWPWLEPFVEIEAQSEQEVKDAAVVLNFDYTQAQFGSVDFFYADKYGVSLEQINEQTPKILFDMDNPFIK